MGYRPLKPYAAIPSQSAAGTILGDQTDVGGHNHVMYQFVYGTITGTITLETSLDGGTTWTTIPGLTITNPTGTAGSLLVLLSNFPGTLIRPKYVHTSGTGNIAAYVCGKGT